MSHLTIPVPKEIINSMVIFAILIASLHNDELN
jgi:hypothetical protein